MINGAERIGRPVDFGDDAIGRRALCGGEQLRKEGFRDIRHIAGDEDIPIGFGDSEGGEQSAQGTAIFDLVGNDGETQIEVFLNRAYERYASGGLADAGGNLIDQRLPVERKQSLVATHATAGSADQNEPRLAQMSHEMIVATSGYIVSSNKKVYICLLMAFAMLAASPSRAADVSSAISVPAATVHKTQVVKADARTGEAGSKRCGFDTTFDFKNHSTGWNEQQRLECAGGKILTRTRCGSSVGALDYQSREQLQRDCGFE